MGNDMDANQEYLIGNGLLESTPEDIALFDQCMASAVPISALWADSNNDPKFVQWDDDLVDYLIHRAALIDREGREKFFPLNIYKELNMKWMDGFNYMQIDGTCAGNSFKSALNASNLVNAKFTGRIPPEIYPLITYSMACSGNPDKPRYRSGCNLNPLAKMGATKGNYWSSDFGKYDGGQSVRKYRGGVQDEHALQSQSIIIPLPEPTFDYCWMLTQAGIAVCLGSSVYPTASRLNSDGFGQASSFKSGAHATCVTFSCTGKSRKRYLYLTNSHGDRYVADSLCDQKQSGCCIDEADFKKMRISVNFGTPHGHLTEMVKHDAV